MLVPEEMLYGYSIGVFPMAHPGENNALYWYEPELRGILLLHQLKISKSLRQTMRSEKFHVTINECFEETLRACANREDTWISEEIIQCFIRLHEMGYAYSFETRNHNNELVGGLYGVAMGKAFFGESMFHTERDASKVALAELVFWLRRHQFTLLDTQYLTPHLASMGAIEIPQKEYLLLLEKALQG
jgi:leucyl/phenylalanyl-tRNA--protein transferase